ncbi:MAG: hydroxysqualene dehydroxylase HpnE [Chthonomonadales bacterium]
MAAESQAENRKTVAVIGGGVAGIAASAALSNNGYSVTLLEKRPMLGGRASSWVDQSTGEVHDACQHGTMRCCTNLGRLFDLLGVHDQIRYHDELLFKDSDGRRSVIRGSWMPAPLHTSWSFLRFGSLGLGDKIAIGRAMLAMLRTPMTADLDDVAVDQWFAKMGQTDRAVRRFWEPILVSACNESLGRISCYHAFKIFRDGFLCHPTAYQFGVPKVPLGTLYTEPTQRYLQSRTGTVELKTTVDRVEHSDGKITGLILQGGERLVADHYVSGLQFDLLLKLLPEEWTTESDYFEKLKQIEFSPIVGIHFWFDRVIDCPEALALLDRESDWIFNKNRNFDHANGVGSYLSVVISEAQTITAMERDALKDLVLEEVRQALPEVREAKVLKWTVLKEKKATFSPKPGIEKLRPSQRSPIKNLFVAGEWTDTGWPSTMEGAARSGFLAAEEVMRADGRPTTLLAPDLPVSGLAKWLRR